MEEEELEHIPWSALVAEHRDERNRTVLMAAGLLAAVLLGYLGARVFTGGRDVTTVSLPASEAVTTIAPEDGDAAATPDASPAEATTSTTDAAGPLSEADLMALVPDELTRAAIARAEWFVTDVFTADLDPEGSAPVRSALPAGFSMPVLPQDTATGVSYVEWARAFRVEPTGNGVYLVDVAFRTLAAPGDGLFSRMEPRAVRTAVRVEPDGGTVVLDLPTPIAPPPTIDHAAVPIGADPAPESVIGSAMAASAVWGYDPQVVSSGNAAGLWRVVVSVTDAVGNRWPLAFWFDTSGSPAVPPH